MFVKIIPAFVVFSSIFSIPTQSCLAVSDDLYAQGVTLQKAGNWQAALEIWTAAADSFQKQGVGDPRIGLAFIELATAKQATQFYEQASRAYFWGFGLSELGSHEEAVREEISRVSPLLEQEEHSEWRELLNKADVTVLKKIKGFWARKDPIPTTEINERLIEHWERIAHVKAEFTLASSTVYGTDDRGLVFMKYGAADEKYGGKLGEDQLEIMRWFDSFSLRQEIQRFNTTPEFEIWRYTGLKRGETTVFLFGKKGGFGKYGLRYGVEEFISDRAFRRSSMQTTRGVLPGAMLQLMYYQDLIQVDPFYLDRFRDLESLWANARAGGRLSPDYDFLRGKISDYKSRDLDTAWFKYLQRDKTDAFEGLEILSLKYKPFRYLDADGQSRLSFIVVSSDTRDDGLDYTTFFGRARKSKYKLRHIVVTYDGDWNVTDRKVDYPALQNTSTSAFSLLHSDDAAYSIVSEKVLLEDRRVRIDMSDIPDTAKVVGVGSSFAGRFVPLSTNPTHFEVSDLLLGVEMQVPVGDYPFPIVPKDPVAVGQSVTAYIELYHGAIHPDKPATIRIDYEIERIKEKGKVDKKKEFHSNSLTFEMAEERWTKMFPIDLINLVPGDYELVFKITNMQSMEEHERKSYLKIVD